MFSLENEIKKWKSQLRKNPHFEDGTIAELESHLRESFDHYISLGNSESEAFAKAVESVGETKEIGNEYKSIDAVGINKFAAHDNSKISGLFFNYLKTTIRFLIKNRGTTAINIIGLAVGFAACILIGSYLLQHITYDSFHNDAENIFRVNFHFKQGENEYLLANSAPKLGDVVMDEFSEIEDVCRILLNTEYYFEKQGRFVKEERVLFADSTFFTFFDFQLFEGDKNSALDDPTSIVLTEESAQKYFGTLDVVGKTMKSIDGNLFTISAVMEKFPSNSHIKADFVIPLRSITSEFPDHWIANITHCYVKLHKKEDIENVNKQLPDFVEKYAAPDLERFLQVPYKELEKQGTIFAYYLLPMLNIHTSTDILEEFEAGPSKSSLFIFASSAILILILACANFINLATARSLNRAPEAGIRKVLGANNANLIKQFLMESLTVSFVGMVLAIVLVQFALPYFNDIAGVSLVLPYFKYWYIIPVLIALVLLVGILAGLYPAILFSKYQPILVIKGKSGTNGKGNWLRGSIVVFQFSISLVLLIGTLIIYQQLNYMHNTDIGFDEDNVIIIPKIAQISDKIESYNNTIKNHNFIKSTSLSSGLPTVRMSLGVFYLKDSLGTSRQSAVHFEADENFRETLDLKLSEGRYLNSHMASDSLAVVINEAAVKAFGFNDPLNCSVYVSNLDEEEMIELPIIGVIKNFVLTSLHQQIKPCIISLGDLDDVTLLSVKIQSGKDEEAVAYLEQVWNEVIQDRPFEYLYMDDEYQENYEAEKQASSIISSFSVVAIIIACMGLFGLITFATEKRTKEIGIRKSLGASSGDILKLLSMEFFKWLAIANIIALPVGFYVTKEWLSNFAYTIDFPVLSFVFASILVMLFAYGTIFYKTLKAATANPVDSIKYE